jgi:hypothetical protein
MYNSPAGQPSEKGCSHRQSQSTRARTPPPCRAPHLACCTAARHAVEIWWGGPARCHTHLAADLPKAGGLYRGVGKCKRPPNPRSFHTSTQPEQASACIAHTRPHALHPLAQTRTKDVVAAFVYGQPLNLYPVFDNLQQVRVCGLPAPAWHHVFALRHLHQRRRASAFILRLSAHAP